MNCFKSWIFFILFFLFFFAPLVFAAQDPVYIYFFWGQGCPHCGEEKVFLKKLEQKYEQLKVLDFEITSSRENIELLEKVGSEFKVDVSGIPFTVVGPQYFIGFHTEETTGKTIEESVRCALENGCPDLVGSLITSVTPNPPPEENKTIPETVSLPLFGEMKTKSLSLPVLTFVIALLDGFNPCAMWVLLFLISLLLGMKDKRRMWVLGTTFIVASSFVYFLFMSAWLNFFLFLGFVFWVRIVIGLVALVAGGYNLRDYFVNKEAACKVTGGERRKRIFQKLEEITQKKEFLVALVGIVLLAFAVNLVELVCSAGLPAVYTQILTLTNLPAWQYYAYLLFYIFIFMLDDLLVFFVAMTTLHAVCIESKYARFSRLVGGGLMLIIGILLIFKPEILMFG